MTYDAEDAMRAAIGWTRRVTRQNCPCRFCAATRRAERENPEHIRTIVPRVMRALTEKEAA